MPFHIYGEPQALDTIAAAIDEIMGKAFKMNTFDILFNPSFDKEF